MDKQADREALARALAAQVLKAPAWAERLDTICQNMALAADRPVPGAVHAPAFMRAVAERAEAILRHIAQADPLTVGRLYFDLLPRDPNHWLTARVMAAFHDGPAVLRMLKDHGTRLELLKDDSGENYLAIHDLGQASGLSDGFKVAIIRALAMTAHLGQPPKGELHSVH